MFNLQFDNVQLGKLFDWQLAWESLPFLLEGIPATLSVSFIGMGIGLVLGFFLALARGSSRIVLRWPARIYISFMRGTPILVFLFILYSGLPVVGIELSAFLAASLAFGLNSAAYIAEINRSSLNSVPQGQWESATSLNMGYWLTLRKIILPQATRIAIPPLANVYLDLVKATSLAAVITVPELFQKAQIVAGRTYDSMTMYILVALIYWPICMVISFMQDRMEKRFSRFMEK
ncbi:ABC transporter permease subunit [Virgibacillus dakarensis]|uniref:Amino-acid ABC transporter permease protein YckA n=1 Tax=Lentibacillus populi TaxID=1827502 RepID=A0A9W5U156_9BACI|nr:MULTISPECIES: amino acid ABC transporter permease [Bacillaceae]MBT2217702.1 amino acid ABC transporter permease [Virgibacillus dakarensis]MTW88287.1 ABC transporter permease subunit [Virgibacillus dakarensis]GGB59779.1 putative amino-acid ABC transporter permease protein YckA [Lentibacillus populi]